MRIAKASQMRPVVAKTGRSTIVAIVVRWSEAIHAKKQVDRTLIRVRSLAERISKFAKEHPVQVWPETLRPNC